MGWVREDEGESAGGQCMREEWGRCKRRGREKGLREKCLCVREVGREPRMAYFMSETASLLKFTCSWKLSISYGTPYNKDSIKWVLLSYSFIDCEFLLQWVPLFLNIGLTRKNSKLNSRIA